MLPWARFCYIYGHNSPERILWGMIPNEHDDHQSALELTERTRIIQTIPWNGPNAQERNRRPLGRTGMDEAHPNERDDPPGARELTKRTRTNPVTSRNVELDNAYDKREWLPTIPSAYGKGRANPTTHEVHGNGPNVLERTRRTRRRTGMNATYTSEPDYRISACECPVHPQGARGWTERTRMNPTTFRAHGNGANASERHRLLPGQTGMY